MKCNKWTLALAAAGVVSLGSVVQADEAPHQVLTALSSTTLSGYVDTSAIWKPGTDEGGTRLPGHVFDGGDKTDGFNLQRVQLTLEKPLDEGQWSAGYKSDLVFGPDANFYATTLNGGGYAQNNVAVKQAYVQLRAPLGNGLDIKMGVFDTIIGYEVFETGNNPNFSRSYGYALEPTHHTGILASYHVADWLSVAGGVANTAFGPINGRATTGYYASPPAESRKAYMGSVTVTLPESTGPLKDSVIYGGVVTGLTGAGFTPTGENTTSWYAGATFKTPLTGLSVGAAFDYRQDGANLNSAMVENNAYSVAGYLTYAFTEKFKVNDRIDYLNADAGTFYGIESGVDGSNKEHLLSNTLTVDYSLWENVITRGEFRWDHSLNGDEPFGGAGNPMRNAYILAMNIIYKF